MSTLEKGIPITLGGKQRRLAYPLCGFIALEEHYGTSLLKGTLKLKMDSLKDVGVALWAGLLHEDEDLKLSEVTAMVTISDLKELSEAISKAFQSSVQDMKGKGKVNGRPLAESGESRRGTKSGPSAAMTSA